MAPSSFILITVLSLAMVAGITEARMGPAGEYKNLQGVGKDVALAESIENLMHGESASFSGENTKDCHSTSSDSQNKGKVFVRDFEPRPSATAYPNDDDAKLKGRNQATLKKDFKSRPNAMLYPNDDDAMLEGRYQAALKKDFEPRPNVSAYPNDSQTTFKKDFESRPNVSTYPNDSQTTFKKDFEPRPSATSYPDTEKEIVKDFEPRPNISVYQG